MSVTRHLARGLWGVLATPFTADAAPEKGYNRACVT